VRGTDAGSTLSSTLFQLQLFGLSGAFLTGDLFNLFVFFEILLLASYGLLLHRRRGQPGSRRAAFRRPEPGRIHALSVRRRHALRHRFGTLNMADLAVKVAATPPENLGVARAAGLLLFGVFALKTALIPLYLWLPAAYSATSRPWPRSSPS
jgi:multicomponent K+:H+ antiporter subunit D